MNDAIRLLVCSEAEADLYAYRRGRETGSVVRIIRGQRCATLDRCMAEWGAAMQLPYCFEGTWQSLKQGLDDLSWPEGTRLVLLLTVAQRILPRASADFAQMLQVLRDYQAGKARQPGAPISVEIILNAEARHAPTVEQRLAAANVSFIALQE